MNPATTRIAQPVLPNLLLNSAVAKSDQAKPSEALRADAKESAENAKEELAIAVANNLADKKSKLANKKASSDELRKRVQNVEKVNALIDQLNSKDKEAELSKKLALAGQGQKKDLLSFVSDNLNSGAEPALLFLSLKKAQSSDSFASDKKSFLNDVINDLLDDDSHLISIKTSLNVADVAAEHFKDPDMAAQLRVLMGRGNATLADPATIISTLLQIGKEENYDKLLNAYASCLGKESTLLPPVPSTHLAYLQKSHQALSNHATAKSVLKSSDECCASLEKLLDLGRINRAEFAKDIVDYTKLERDDQCQNKIGEISKKYGLLGKKRLLVVANQAQKMVDSLSPVVWAGGAKARANSIQQLKLFVGSNLENRRENIRLNRAFV